MSSSSVRAVCGSCAAGCGIIVELEGERVVRVRGDVSHPTSNGYLCQKGHRIPWFHHRPDRLDEPLLHGRPATWDTCLDDLAGHMGRALDEHGPDSVGIYWASGMSGDAAGMLTLGRFRAAIGTRQLYTSMTVDHAPALRAQELVTGSPELVPTWVPEDPDGRLVLFVGCNPAVSHGYMTVLPDPIRRIRRFQQRGGKLWVVDPRRTKTAEMADGHLATRSGTDPALLAWLVRELLASSAGGDELRRTTSPEDRARLAAAVGPFDVVTTSRITGVPAPELDGLLDAIRAAGRIAVVTGSGLLFAPNGLVGEWLRWALMAVTGSLDVPGGMWFNPGWLSAIERRDPWEPAPPEGSLAPGPRSRPELSLVFGEMPCVAMADEIEAGTLRVLIVAGGSPLTAFPEPERTAAALGRLDALAVMDVVASPLTAMATHLFPSAGQLERTNIQFYNGRVTLSRRVVAPAADRRPVWRLFAGLAQRLGLDVLGGLEADVATEDDLIRQRLDGARDDPEALFAAGAHGILPPRTYGWVRRFLPEGRWRIAPPSMLARLPALLDPAVPDRPFRLICRRVTATKNSADYLPIDRLADRPALAVHPDDGVALGVGQGEHVEIESQAGTVRGVVRLDPSLPRGVVSMLHGSNTTNVGGLTSTVTSVDPLTGEPVMTAIPVSIRRLLGTP
jgi:anaerobic selenocysteine-containing dehydrogenase